MKPRFRRLLGWVLFSLLTSTVANAQFLDNPRGLAMGALTADPIGTAAVMYNPAGLSKAYLYQVDMIYLRNAPGDLNVAGFSIADSKSNSELAMGISYGFHFSDEKAPMEERGHDARLAFSRPVIGDRLFLGLDLRYLDIEKGTEGLSGFTADAGLLLSVSKEFHLGLIGKNLFKIDDPLVSRKVGGGIALTGQSLTLTSDVLVDLDRHEEGAKPIFAVGLESLAGGTVPLRIGYTNDQVTEHHLLGGGVGFILQDGGGNGQLMISYRQNLTETEFYIVTLGLTMFL